MPKMIKAAVTTIRTTRVTDQSEKLLFADLDRRFYLVQNLSTIESIEVSSVQNGGGEVIPPTGAKLIDMSTGNELWARNPNNTNPVTVAIEEISGYNPWEIRMLYALETIAEVLQQAVSGRR